METGEQINQFGPAKGTSEACDGASQANTGCKIIPFRKKSVREPLRTSEAATGCRVAEPFEEECFEERGRFPAVFQHECLRTPCGYGQKQLKEEPSPSAPLAKSRWLKKVLLMSTFTAGVVAAIALTIVLG